MKKAGKIIGINLLVLLAYSLPLRFGDEQQYGPGNMIAMAFFIFFQFLINIISSVSYEEEESRPAFLISAILVLMIGFATCTTPPNR